MKNQFMNINQSGLTDFVKEYDEIVKSVGKSVIIQTQWSREGDYFERLTLYDNSYVPVQTLGSTTLIKNF